MRLESGEYFGEVKQSINLNGLTLSKSNYAKDSSLPLHGHQNPYFCYVLNGSYSEHYNKKALVCLAGDVIFHQAEIEHSNDFNNDLSTCFNLEMSKTWLERVFESDVKMDSIIKTTDTAVQNTIIKLHTEFNNFDTLSPLMIEGLMIETLVLLFRNYRKERFYPNYIRHVKQYIDDQYYNNPTLSELSTICKVSPEHLVRGFKSTFNITIGDYARQVKVKNSCNKLKLTNQKLAEIAFEMGFSDQSHFNRVFKKIMGVTPLEYRLAK